MIVVRKAAWPPALDRAAGAYGSRRWPGRHRMLQRAAPRAPLFYWAIIPRLTGDCVCAHPSRYLLQHGWRCLMKIDLTGKTALVTGSTSGIGHATAKGLAAAGAEVLVKGRGRGKGDAAVPSIDKARLVPKRA